MAKEKSSFPKNRAASHPLRVLIIFGLGIIIPSAVLSFLGFRSLQIESLLLHKQAEDRYAALADLMQRNINDIYAGLIQDLRKKMTHASFQAGTLRGMTNHLTTIQSVSEQPVKAMLLFDTQGHLIVPSLAGDGEDAPRPTADPDWGIYSGEMRRLQRLEFVQRNVTDAVAGYAALQDRVDAPALQAALLKNLASASRKLGRRPAAEHYYLELIHRFDQLPDPSGYPTGILGRQLLAQLYDGASQAAPARGIRLDLAEGLIIGQWHVSARQREFLLSDLKKRIFQDLSVDAPESRATHRRWDELESLNTRLNALRLYARDFLKNAWPGVQARIQSRSDREQGVVLRNPPHEALILSPVPAASGKDSKYIVLAAVHETPILEEVRQALDKLGHSSGVRTELGDIRQTPDSRMQRMKTSLQPQVIRPITAVEPPMEIRLLEDSGAEKALRRRWTWIYFGMIGLSLMVIVVGLAIMAQAIRREMEVANMKADFVANVSHELRTPLSAISYIGERLSLGRYRSSEEVKEFYDMLGEETGRLRELIEDILDFSKMLDGRKAYVKKSVDLVDLAKEAADRIHGKAESKGFKILPEYPPGPVIAPVDRKAVVQAIMNLVDNAIKYSGDAREIRLRIREEDGWAVSEVQDAGIGISVTDQAKIFEKFYRVEEAMTRGSEGGVGLGLAMVKHIAEGHGGKITVASAPGKGSTFSLWFKMKEDTV